MLHYPLTKITPQIDIDTDGCVIVGESQPEDSVAFFGGALFVFAQLVERADKYTITIFLSYFNTSTSAFLLELVKIAERARQRGCTIQCYWWYYDDDADGRESGEELFAGTLMEHTVQYVAASRAQYAKPHHIIL